MLPSGPAPSNPKSEAWTSGIAATPFVPLQPLDVVEVTALPTELMQEGMPSRRDSQSTQETVAEEGLASVPYISPPAPGTSTDSHQPVQSEDHLTEVVEGALAHLQDLALETEADGDMGTHNLVLDLGDLPSLEGLAGEPTDEGEIIEDAQREIDIGTEERSESLGDEIGDRDNMSGPRGSIDHDDRVKDESRSRRHVAFDVEAGDEGAGCEVLETERGEEQTAFEGQDKKGVVPEDDVGFTLDDGQEPVAAATQAQASPTRSCTLM